jgi:RecJ-like exonuclease
VGQPSYVGVHVCAGCHGAAKVFWDTTRHASAYPTLSFQNKQFNLDCVSCHVTGYDKPGGSSVTHVANLENVQCEVCHGPGSLHAASPKVDPPNKHPKEDLCLACHHPPHVEEFDAKAKMSEILGPGHGV